MGRPRQALHRVTWLALALCLLAAPGLVGAQTTGVLRVSIALQPPDGAAAIPIRKHALLVSDNPPSRSPWRIVTGADGMGRVTLPPGNYTVESETPLVFHGKAYEWRQVVDVTVGADVSLTLSASNAEVSTPAATTDAPGEPAKTDPWDLLLRWQDSVVTVWTPATHASGIVIGPGLVATTHRVVQSETDLEVQLTATLKVAAQVVATDPSRDAAILRVAPSVLASRTPVPLACEEPARPPLARGDAISAISTPLRRHPTTSTGRITRIATGPLAAIFDIPLDSPGGPVFAADGRVIGLASLTAEDARAEAIDADITRVEAICDLLASARSRVDSTAAPPDTPRPIEPEQVVAEDVLRERAKQRTGSLQPPKVSTPGFDVAFLTPVLAYAGLQQTSDFGQWTMYVADRPSVLLIRATPRQTESFWMKVARGAAMTQGIALPPITRFEPGFARLRVRCGEREITPIHPFRIERRITETTAIREGLYVFATDAIGPDCARVTIELFSEKAPDKGETVTIERPLLEQIRRDLASTAPAAVQ